MPLNESNQREKKNEIIMLIFHKLRDKMLNKTLKRI